MTLTHPLFARDAVSGRYVDVEEVPRGLACGCVCTVCGTRLVAKQGEVLAWHFAHEASARCPRSSADAALDALVSMLAQVLGEPTALALPEYRTARILTRQSGLPGAPLLVARASSVVLDAPVRTPFGDGAGVGLSGSVRGHPLELVLESRDARTVRGIPGRARVAMEIDAIVDALLDVDGPPGPTERLRGWLSDRTSGRRWLSHPREASLRQREGERAAREAAGIRRAAPSASVRHVYRCEPCWRTFEDVAGSKPPCPRCGEAFWIQALGPARR